MKVLRLSRIWSSAVLIVTASLAIAQTAPSAFPGTSDPYSMGNADQVAKILGFEQLVSNARRMNKERVCGSAVTLEELSMRQEILETVVSASFDVDGVLAELDNERARLSEFSSALQSRRDHTLNIMNVANLVTGTGVGIGVNALQFSSSTANFGNGLGVGSGIGSTVLSIIGIRRQRGPLGVVGKVPNMLAPLFARQPILNSYYPETVMAYLHSIPTDANNASPSRLDQLMAEWRDAGRLGPIGSPKTEAKINLLTTSMDKKTKVSIDDLSDRIAMLDDVRGRVALMKRDLAQLMMSIRADKHCESR